MGSEILFVRHGTTDAAENKMLPSDTAELSERGRQEIHAIRPQLDGLQFDTIVCSPLIRTVQTADILIPTEQKRNLSPLFIEVQRPKFVEGQVVSPDMWLELDAVHTGQRIDIPPIDYESYAQLWDRVGRAKDFLVGMNMSRILVVTHNIFTKMFIYRNIFGLPQDGEAFIEFSKSLRIANGSLLRFKVDENGRLSLTI